MTGTGDINQDGQVDAKDLNLLSVLVHNSVALLNSLSPQEKALLDVNSDSQINVADIDALCNRLLNNAAPLDADLRTELSRLREKLKS